MSCRTQAPIISGCDGSVFTDCCGFEHRLIPGYRSKIKPGWERMLAEVPAPPASDEAVRPALREIASRVRLGAKMLATFGCRLDGRRVLDVGCSGFEELMYLAGAGAATVVGSDIAPTVKQGEGQGAPAGREPEASDRIRRLIREHLEALSQFDRFERAEVTLICDDMGASSLRDASFDVLCSWRTLEHLTRPEEAFAEMYRVLAPGGFVFHEYNPFFAIDGGHSLATLDFPWGHVRLTSRDVERYLKRFRPEELGAAMDLFRHQLNRLTIADTERIATDAGFEVLALVPRARTEDLLEATEVVYAQARRNHPGITINDLTCRIVRMVLRRP